MIYWHLSNTAATLGSVYLMGTISGKSVTGSAYSDRTIRPPRDRFFDSRAACTFVKGLCKIQVITCSLLRPTVLVRKYHIKLMLLVLVNFTSLQVFR